MSLRDNEEPQLLDLFSFEEMTTLADEARILGLRAALAANPAPHGVWIDVPADNVSAFSLLAAHPRLLAHARAHLNAEARAASLRIWVGTASVATPAQITILGDDHGIMTTAVICLNGFARLSAGAMPTLAAGAVLWMRAGAGAALSIDGKLMLCTIAYEAVGERAAPQAVADDSLWPAAYVSAG